MGVPRERIAMRGYGEAFPVAPNDTASANRQLNRRVEIVLSNDARPIPPRAAGRDRPSTLELIRKHHGTEQAPWRHGFDIEAIRRAARQPR
jgi:hypothetical protein